MDEEYIYLKTDTIVSFIILKADTQTLASFSSKHPSHTRSHLAVANKSTLTTGCISFLVC